MQVAQQEAHTMQAAPRGSGGFSFSSALVALKDGMKVAREGWNGRRMFLFLVGGSHFKVNRPPLLGIYPEGTGIDYHAHIDMKTAQGYVVPWVASQADLLADDWVIVEPVDHNIPPTESPADTKVA